MNMRRRKMRLVLICSVLAVLFLTGIYSYNIYKDYYVPVPYESRVMEIPIVDNLDFLEGRTKLTSEQNPGVYFGQTLMPYTSNGTLYLSQNYEVEEWVGEMVTDSRDTFLCTLPDEAWEDKAGSIRNNHVFKLWMVGEDCYYELNLIVCGMPVMTITTEREEPQDKVDYEVDPDRYIYDPDIIWYGSMQLFNPGVGVDQYEIIETDAKYYLRGKNSTYYEKKGYTLKLLDTKGENLDVSLLGMRLDNNWKLKSLIEESNRVLEKTACEIWEMFDQTNLSVDQPGPHMEYVELIMDNEYLGFYGLMEPVDEKKLELDDNDILYKIATWDLPEDEDIQYSIDRRWRIANIRIRYPDIIDDYEEAWYPMRDYLNTFYRSQGDDDRPVQDKINLQNAVDVLLFTMAISGSDNYYNNLYYAADVNEGGIYVMRQIPWDFDVTFGYLGHNGFLGDESVIYEEKAIPYLRETDPDMIGPILQERWEECRKTFLTTENILTLLYDNMDYLINTGAVERENERWADYVTMSTDLDNVVDYQMRRMEWLDDYFMYP